MEFTFNGTLEELKETICAKALELNKDIIVYDDSPNVLKIGFQRLGHSGGRFFVANVTEKNGQIVLCGEFKDLYLYENEKVVHKFMDDIIAYLIIYAFIEVIPFIVWLLLFQFADIWIPLMLPIPVMIVLRVFAKIQDKKTDEDFVEFMSALQR